MNVYRVQVKYGSNGEKNLDVLAKDAAEACDDARRHMAKNYYTNSCEVVMASKTLTVDVFYKTRPSKKKR